MKAAIYAGVSLPVGRPRRVFDRARVAELRALGTSYRQIASKLGLGEGTVRRVLRAATGELEARQNPTAGIL
jgi:transposase